MGRFLSSTRHTGPGIQIQDHGLKAGLTAADGSLATLITAVDVLPAVNDGDSSSAAQATSG
jgi:hypothetical protein